MSTWYPGISMTYTSIYLWEISINQYLSKQYSLISTCLKFLKKCKSVWTGKISVALKLSATFSGYKPLTLHMLLKDLWFRQLQVLGLLGHSGRFNWLFGTKLVTPDLFLRPNNFNDGLASEWIKQILPYASRIWAYNTWGYIILVSPFCVLKFPLDPIS